MDKTDPTLADAPPRKRRAAQSEAFGSIATRQRLLDSAEREFAASGFAGGSLRRIAAGASVTLGCIRHHFGSKADLLFATVVRCYQPLKDERLTALDALTQRDSWSTGDVLDAYFAPTVRFLAPPLGTQRGHLGMRGIFEHEIFWPAVQHLYGNLDSRFCSALGRTLPGTPAEEVAYRWSCAVQVVFHNLIPEMQNVEEPQPVPEEHIRRLRRYAMAILAGGARDDAPS